MPFSWIRKKESDVMRTTLRCDESLSQQAKKGVTREDLAGSQGDEEGGGKCKGCSQRQHALGCDRNCKFPVACPKKGMVARAHAVRIKGNTGKNSRGNFKETGNKRKPSRKLVGDQT